MHFQRWKRREFITLLGSAAACPLAARAQQPAKLPTIGFLISGPQGGSETFLTAFRKGLGQTGYVEKQNVVSEFRWAQDQYERLPGLAEELVQQQVAMIVAFGAVRAPLAAKAATSTIPILFTMGSDPVEFGLVAALNRPGGNITGVTNISRELLAKRYEILSEVVPKASSIGLMVNPGNPNSEPSAKEMQLLARAGGWHLQVVQASNESELYTAFDGLVRLKAEGLLLGTDALFNATYKQVAALAARHAIPAVYQYREFVDAGGLMSYGTNRADSWHQLGIYAGRILRGEKPADLPVQQSTKVELLLNLKAAKALGITFPLTLLGRADAVIE